MDIEAKPIDILYICTPSSIHDQKWMSFFSLKNKNYTVYVVYEKNNTIDESTLQQLKSKNINLFGPIDSFSITKPLKTIRSILFIRKIIMQHNIKLVHVLFSTPYALWANFFSVPYVITTRGSDALIVLPSLLNKKYIKGLYFKFLFRLFQSAFKGASEITCTSSTQRQKIKQLFNLDNVTIIKTGIDVEKVQSSRNELKLNPLLRKRKFIFSPRFFSPIYNIELQVDAIKELSSEIRDKYVFVFIKGKDFDLGYADMLISKLENLKKDYGIEYVIENYLDQETIWTYYNYASLTVLTPLSDGTPNSALEAMAAKCPLIIPDLNYDSDLFVDSCMVLRSYNCSDLATLVESSVLNYPDELLNKAFEKLMLFGNRKKEMEKLDDLYVKIIHGKIET